MSSSVWRRLSSLFQKSPSSTKSRISLPSSKPIIDRGQEQKSQERRRHRLKKLLSRYKKLSLSGENLSRFESFIVRLAKSQEHDLVHNFLQTQKTHRNITDEAFTAQLILLYGKAKMFDHARKVFDEMPELKCERTVMSLNALLAACVSSKEFHRVEDLFKELPASLNVEPNLVTWSVIINSFCQSGRLDDALLMLDEMERKGIEPNVVTFNTLIHAFYKNDRFEDGEKTWKMMEERKVCPDIRSYNSKLQGLASKEMMVEAVELIEELRTKELQLDGYSYNALIRGFCAVGNLEEAKKWYDEMGKSKVLPDRVTFAVLTPFLCRKGDFDASFRICKDFMKINLIVNTEKIQDVVDGLVKESKIDKATELVDLGKSNGYFLYKLVLPDNN